MLEDPLQQYSNTETLAAEAGEAKNRPHTARLAPRGKTAPPWGGALVTNPGLLGATRRGAAQGGWLGLDRAAARPHQAVWPCPSSRGWTECKDEKGPEQRTCASPSRGPWHAHAPGGGRLGREARGARRGRAQQLPLGGPYVTRRGWVVLPACLRRCTRLAADRGVSCGMLLGGAGGAALLLLCAGLPQLLSGVVPEARTCTSSSSYVVGTVGGRPRKGGLSRGPAGRGLQVYW